MYQQSPTICHRAATIRETILNLRNEWRSTDYLLLRAPPLYLEAQGSGPSEPPSLLVQRGSGLGKARVTLGCSRNQNQS